MQRHFTVTTFVSADGATLLHWHAKSRMWLPPGGHIEPNEDPLQAALREALEETGIVVTLLPTAELFAYASPRQLPPPATVMVEPIPAAGDEAAHEHLDLIYFARPLESGRPKMDGPRAEVGWRWVSSETLRADQSLYLPAGRAQDDAIAARVPGDVRVLGLAAIERAAQSR